ncbi:putative redox protein [Flavobacterium croceum DSM 17960]|uniref:Putative redox protein n=1 Tax=Flavobacterium croceum DSM 17960 TaxID=1121886 RepID=A0A2S4N6Z2_9FLAO|nr:OsmC family protein [Flavobacterium croceum]POS01450.1 putative redox protein [Flavobacterium croceum DSM 17960]
MENLLDKNITAFIGSQKYLCTVTWRNGILIMDEPNSIGGKDLGPDPYSTLLASLAGCTLSTLRMYIDRKGWQIPEINISLNFTQNNSEEIETVITREISFPQQVTEEQQERLKVIAEKCPVSKILKNKITINTKI